MTTVIIQFQISNYAIHKKQIVWTARKSLRPTMENRQPYCHTDSFRFRSSRSLNTQTPWSSSNAQSCTLLALCTTPENDWIGKDSRASKIVKSANTYERYIGDLETRLEIWYLNIPSPCNKYLSTVHRKMVPKINHLTHYNLLKMTCSPLFKRN